MSATAGMQTKMVTNNSWLTPMDHAMRCITPSNTVLCTKLDAECNRQAMVVSQLLPTFADNRRAVVKLFLGHMQICTLSQTDNHASTPLPSFLQAGYPSCRPTNSVKALKAFKTLGQVKKENRQKTDECKFIWKTTTKT